MPNLPSASAFLLALPGALALGAPAIAQNVISGPHDTGINLSLYSAAQIAAGASVTNTGAAAVWSTGAGQLANQGSVADANGAGVYLGGGGGVNNAGSITGDNGVWLLGGGSVDNSGLIAATQYGVRANAPAQVSNEGNIHAGWDGVSLNDGGAVTNSGSVFGGHMGVYTGGAAGVVLNTGAISAGDGDAVSLYNGGTLTNTATGILHGGYSGTFAGGNGALILNAGFVSGAQFGAYLTGASEVNNSGTMAGGVTGAVAMGRGGVIENTGVITGGETGVRVQPGGTLENEGLVSGGTLGVRMQRGDLVNSGSITGATGVALVGSTLLDTGTITGTDGIAVELNGAASTLTLGNGAVVKGDIAGNGTASQISLTGTGVLSSDITGLNAGGGLNIAQGANWTASGTWTVANVTNAGMFTPGSVPAPLTINGNFTQLSSGTLRIAVTPTAVTAFTVNGTATLAGTLVYVLAPGSYTPHSETFLTATGGVSGDFATVTSSSPMMATSSAPVPHAPRVVSVTHSFTVAPQDSALVPATTQALGTEALGSANVLLNHENGCTTPVAPTAAGAALAQGFCAAGGWVQASGDAFSASGDFRIQGGGVLGGIDHGDATGGRVGLALGVDSNALKDAQGGKASLSSLRVGVYATQPVGDMVLGAGLLESFSSLTTTRNTGYGSANGKLNANSLAGVAQAELPFTLDGVAFTPAAGLRVAYVTTGALNETAATQAFAVTARAGSDTVVQPFARLTIARPSVLGGGYVFAPAVSLGGSDTLAGLGQAATLRAADGTDFTTTARHLAPLTGELGVGASLSQGNWTLHAAYSAQVSGNSTAQSLLAGIVVRF